MEVKRSLENRIKKRVKNQFSRGKFYDLMDAVIVNGDTLRDAYDIIRVDSNVDLSSAGDDGLCFLSIAGELAGGGFDVGVNTTSILAKNGGGRLVLPNLKLRIIQEAVRVALEVVYRPYFSKLSHGGRSGRGHSSALRFVSREVGGDIDWWFTLPMNAQADINIVSKLISMMEEKIDDAHLFSFIRELYQAEVLNLSFGVFPKGHGLPQEGALSPILMNIYLHALDQELLRISMRYECLGDDPSSAPPDGRRSKLRAWLRRRITGGGGGDSGGGGGEEPAARFHACRFMDEVFIAIRGTRDSACSLRDEVLEFLRSSLFIEPGHLVEVLSVEDCPQGLQFLGMALRVVAGGGGGGGGAERTRAVHKLRDKVRSFAYQKKDHWEALTTRLGKKWLAHGLKRLKESEILPLRRSTPTLDQISCFRKEGMKTDHWFKTLLKVWLQDVGGAAEADEEAVLRKLFAEQALPEDLRESFRRFQLQVEEYLLAETISTQELLSEMRKEAGSGGAVGGSRKMVVAVEAPVRFIERRLLRYGVVDRRGNPRCVHELVLQDDALIVSWFAGLAGRWLRWFAGAANFRQVEAAVAGRLRRSCVRTLAVKHRMAETVAERRFAEELAATPLAGADSSSGDLLAGGESSSGDLLAGEDEALTYGVGYGGLCVLTLERVAVPCRRLRCSVVGCPEGSPAIYALRVKERQTFPGWKTGFSAAIFLGLTGRRVALCRRHVEDLYLGLISLRAVDFRALN